MQRGGRGRASCGESGQRPWLSGSEIFLCCSWDELRGLHPVGCRPFPGQKACGPGGPRSRELLGRTGKPVFAGWSGRVAAQREHLGWRLWGPARLTSAPRPRTARLWTGRRAGERRSPRAAATSDLFPSPPEDRAPGLGATCLGPHGTPFLGPMAGRRREDARTQAPGRAEELVIASPVHRRWARTPGRPRGWGRGSGAAWGVKET